MFTTVAMDKVLAEAAHFARSLIKVRSIELRVFTLTNPSDHMLGTVMPVLSHACQFLNATKLMIARNKEVLVLDAHTHSLLGLTDAADALLEIGEA